MRWWRLLAALLAAVVGGALAGLGALGGFGAVADAATPTVSVVQNASYGPILVGPNGMTLYYFKKDSAGVSNCAGSCAAIWPPLTVTSAPTAGTGLTGTLGTIQRSDGTTQVTYNGWPLYYYAADAQPGDTNGEGILSVWYVAPVDLTAAPPAAATSTAAAPAPASSTASGSSTAPTSGPTISVAQNATLGPVLVGPNGDTLYYFLKDQSGVNNCAGKCATIWPALTVSGANDLTLGPGVAGAISLIPGPAGTLQVTYNGWPLYEYVGDKAPGQANGQGFLKIWYAATPGLAEAPSVATAAAAPPATTTTTSSPAAASNAAPSTTAATLPRTGGRPWPEAAGALFLLGGAALLLRRPRRDAA